jgi:hypothetical protein
MARREAEEGQGKEEVSCKPKLAIFTEHDLPSMFTPCLGKLTKEFVATLLI